MTNRHGAPRRPVLLVVLDGFGANPGKRDNAVIAARTPNLDDAFGSCPHTLIQCSGKAAGLPEGQMGNSEVGHMILGSGMVVRQDLVKIDDAIADGSFYTNPELTAAMDRAAAAGRPVHLMGLVSDGGVHSHVNHLIALLKLARRRGATPAVHMITDGRDTPPRSARQFLEPVERALAAGGGSIATVSGRYYAMDRDNRWGRTEMAWQAVVQGRGRRAPDARAAIEQSYAADEDDEFLVPTVVDGAEPVRGGDELVFFNFRKDRPRQIVSALFDPEFKGFDRGDYTPPRITCMTEYDQWYGLPYAFEHERPAITLGKVLSEAGLQQFHCAETEKYAHVTFFFNGGRGDAYPGEDRVIVPSPDVPTYDMQPEMSAPEVTRELTAAMRSGRYAFIVANYANGDMVGHTAERAAVVEAVEVLDREVGQLLEVAGEEGYSVIVTADHGNCEEMVDPATGEPHTQHTIYPVPCLVVDEVPWRLAVGGGLANIAPTVLHLMGLPKPAVMTADSLLLGPVRS